MYVTKGHTQRIRCIGLQLALQTQQDANHMLHLVFLGTPFTYQGLLDLARRIFINRDPVRNDGTDRGTTGLSEFQRRIGILVHKNLFDRQLIRIEFADHLANTLENLLQAVRKAFAGHSNTTAGNVLGSVGCGIDDTKTSDSRPGINT